MTDDAPTQALPAAGVPDATDASDGSDVTATRAATNVTRLIHEAASKSGLVWIRIPGAGTHPVWHVWHDDGDDRGTGPAAYVVSGPGEQSLPWLPDEVELVLRSKDSGGLLLSVHASAQEVTPADEGWDAAVEVLRPERLNAVGDVASRWAQGCTIHVITPHGRLVEGPGAYGSDSGAAPVRPSAGTTARWRPWHWRGRAGARRNSPDE